MGSNYMRCLIIHNPVSGPRSDEIDAFVHAFSQAGDEIVMRYLGDGLEAADAVADAATFDRIVLSGGDGTISNLADSLQAAHVTTPVLIFPSGTANLFFNNIGNALEPAALAKACREGRTAPVDMGELFWQDADGCVQRHGFLIIAGSGYDATIMEKAEDMKADMGEFAYLMAALNTPNPQVAHFTIEHEGGTEEYDGIACMIANTATIQGEINLFPDCRMDDGYLDIAVIEPAATVQLLPTVLAGIFDPSGKGIGRPQFKMLRAKEVKVTCEPSMGMQFDGEIIPSASGVFGARVLPSALNVIVDDFAKLKPRN